MKLSINQKNLQRALSYTERITSRNLTLPVLQNVILKTESGRLKILATNLEVGVSVFVGAKVDEVGEVAVPGRVFSEFIAAVPDESITISTKNSTLTLQSETCKTTILGADTKEYPIIPKIKTDPICSIPGDVLRTALEGVSGAIAVSDARAELAGVYAQFSHQVTTFAATDVFRLAEYQIPVEATLNQAVIIPRNTVLELVRMCGETSGVVDIRIGDNQASFTTSDVELISRLVDGKYPDYKRVIPDKFITKVILGRDSLERAARLAGLFSSSISDIKIHGDDKELIITAHNADRGATQASVQATVKGDPFDIALNFHYLIDGLKTMPAGKVILEFTGQGSPLVIRPSDNPHERVYLVMPFRS